MSGLETTSVKIETTELNVLTCRPSCSDHARRNCTFGSCKSLQSPGGLSLREQTSEECVAMLTYSFMQ